MKAAAHRKPVVTSSAKPAAIASDVSRSVTPVDSLKSSIMRWNMCPPRLVERIHEMHGGPPASPSAPDSGLAGAHHGSAPPGDADQETEADRKADRRNRTLDDGVFHRLLQRGRRVLRRIHHGAAALGDVADGVFRGGAGLLVAAARFLARGAGERVHHV